MSHRKNKTLDMMMSTLISANSSNAYHVTPSPKTKKKRPSKRTHHIAMANPIVSTISTFLENPTTMS